MILFKYLEIVGHVLYGFYVVILPFRFADQERRNQFLQNWSQKLLRILGVQIEITGNLNQPASGVLYVSNHISWLDIHVINAWQPMRFVAKKEVGEWPVFGWFAKQLNTLFIDRQRKGDSKNVSKQMVQALGSGDHICIFPEGTSSIGDHVLPFKPNLFQAALEAQVACQPISITYTDLQSGGISYGPAFIGDMGLLESIANTVKAAPIKVTVAIMEECQSRLDRKSLSDEAWGKINSSRCTNN
ncbi:1-acyl-sn-glycerol-3-phosphate acyltransferase [Polynucleobacter sp. SHI8]|uniref:lysophospholipid acyltransferase family protein n=1 Tax=unclassified Polynucleobacter TaxID=2640945 RepID=UPI002490C354|nr:MULTISPECIES: lysophospholipid acyltransferase family protein [unclassified Polynucleobacter]BDW10616.1 1-acyl-sn-glycerol-3-phosphate acyltransferase [Polynucleobacter sp. SHI2]BDW13062.1 1-acyl-sn-glycerol-3-phosphate acyltransferase [Polynucleobacter sp. SHI8]